MYYFQMETQEHPVVSIVYLHQEVASNRWLEIITSDHLRLLFLLFTCSAQVKMP
jgi:hypothetical protein